jgi:hypothetical protein
LELLRADYYLIGSGDLTSVFLPATTKMACDYIERASVKRIGPSTCPADRWVTKRTG